MKNNEFKSFFSLSGCELDFSGRENDGGPNPHTSIWGGNGRRQEREMEGRGDREERGWKFWWCGGPRLIVIDALTKVWLNERVG